MPDWLAVVEWPNNWLDWLTLVGAIAGILSAIHLFVASRWLNWRQLQLLAGASDSIFKSLRINSYGSAGVAISLVKDNKYTDSMAGRVEKGFNSHTKGVIYDNKSIQRSHRNKIFLDELVSKGYFTKKTDENYVLTAKGIRHGRFWACILPAWTYLQEP